MRLIPGGRKAVAHGGYDEWAAYLNAWAEGGAPDGGALGPLDEGHFAPDTWSRLMNRFTDALGKRFEAWHDALLRATGAAMRDEFEYGRALQQGRDGLHAIRALAADERLPESMRTKLTDAVDGKLTEIQRRLEDDLQRQRDRGDSVRLIEARLRTLRDNALTAVTVQAKTGVAAVAAPPDGLPRKRVIQR